MAKANSQPIRRAHRRSREPLSLFPDALRRCSGCQRDLPPDAFNRDKKNRDGLNSNCRECRSAANKAAHAARPQAYAMRISMAHRTRTYGITAERFAALVEAQSNACGICGVDMGKGKGRHVDHCHMTGNVRALLCHRCNVALGMARDDPGLLRTMADYIERHMQVE